MIARMILAAGAFAACTSEAASTVRLDQLIEARDLLCDFYDVKDWATAEARYVLRDRSDMLMMIQDISSDPNAARVTDTLAAGRRKLRRHLGETGVHFVEDRDGSVIVTTLLACEDTKKKRGREVCVRYSAMNSWLLGVNVQRDPDDAIRRAAAAYKGVCEPWKVD